MESKICTKCGIEKDFKSFSKGKGKYGFASHCRECKSAWRKLWKLANPDKVKTSKKNYRAKSVTHKLAKKAQNKRWKVKNLNKVKEWGRGYHANRINLLKDGYISHLIKAGASIPTKEILQYPELIEAKRTQLMILRILRKK